MTNPWFKFYAQDYLASPTIARLTACERSCWVTLLSLASLKKNKIEFLDEVTLMVKSGLIPKTTEWEITEGVLEKFVKFKMITLDNELITLNNFSERQEINLTSYERVKKHREKKRDDNEVIQNDNTRRDKNREEEKRIDKSIYGEFGNVLLKEDEYQKLIEKLGEKNTAILIGELDTGIESKGYKYKSHYATILNWARRKFQEHSDKKLKGKAVI